MYYFHGCVGTTTGITSLRTERLLALPFANDKAGREVLAFVLTLCVKEVRHFLVAEGSTAGSGDLP